MEEEIKNGAEQERKVERSHGIQESPVRSIRVNRKCDISFYVVVQYLPPSQCSGGTNKHNAVAQKQTFESKRVSWCKKENDRIKRSGALE